MQCVWNRNEIKTQTVLYLLMNYSIHRGKESSFLSSLILVLFEKSPTGRKQKYWVRHLVAEMVLLKTFTKYKTAVFKWSQWPSGLMTVSESWAQWFKSQHQHLHAFILLMSISLTVIIISWWPYLASPLDGYSVVYYHSKYICIRQQSICDDD